MADHWQAEPQGPRWNVNLPAVVGVVFVFLLGVVIWVIAASAGDDDSAPSSSSSLPGLLTTTIPTSTTGVNTLVPTSTAPPTAPVPSTPPPSTAAVTTVPPPPTTQPPPPPTGTGPLSTAPPEEGDLGVPGHAIQRPPCDGAYITILGSAIGDEATPEAMAATLDDYPGSNYLRTDLTCPSLTQSRDGEHIYVIYFGPFVVDSDACTARTDGPPGAYVRRLSNELTPAHSVSCN